VARRAFKRRRFNRRKTFRRRFRRFNRRFRSLRFKRRRFSRRFSVRSHRRHRRYARRILRTIRSNRRFRVRHRYEVTPEWRNVSKPVWNYQPEVVGAYWERRNRLRQDIRPFFHHRLDTTTYDLPHPARRFYNWVRS